VLSRTACEAVELYMFTRLHQFELQPPAHSHGILTVTIDMRLLRVDTLEFVELDEPATRVLDRYAILSHTWRYGHEILFEDVAPKLQDTAKLKPGFSKVANACKQAAKDGLEYIWIDTCCMDKKNSAELQEVINRMQAHNKKFRRCSADPPTPFS